MVRLTRIYTRTGDDGSTALGNFERVPKTDARLVAYADTHEANAAIGLAVAFLRQDAGNSEAASELESYGAASASESSGAASAPGNYSSTSAPESSEAEPARENTDAAAAAPSVALADVLERVQNDLFDVGADLSVPLNPAPSGPELRVQEEWITELETYCDHFGEDLPKLESFILPGGSTVAAQLHVASTVVRRAERAAWVALAEFGDDPDGGVNPLTAKYLNRLSDLLFIMARYANGAHGDILWQPAGGRLEPPKKRGNRR